MKSIIILGCQTIVIILFVSILSHPAFCQGTPDPPFSTSTVESDNHAVLKLRSDNYIADTTTLKFTNMDNSGTGTEFLIQSVRENGLKISSNSDLSTNTSDSILMLRPNGEVIVGDLKGPGIRHVSVNENGQLIRGASEYFFNPIVGFPISASAYTPPDIYTSPINPHTAVRIETNVNVGPSNFQWFNIPISLPAGPVESITVCCTVTDNATDGQAASIRTVRLCRMVHPNGCTVDIDNLVNLTGSLICHEAINMNLNPLTSGSPTVLLQIVLGSDDFIDIGQISVKMK